MGTPDFPLARIHGIAAASCLCWFATSLAAHLITAARWKGYHGLSRSERLQWCNKVACGIHAAVLVYHQAWNLRDPVLNADPLNAVTPSHFTWASVLFGYLIYDTLYSLMFFSWRSGAAFLLHHVVGLAGCSLGLYWNKLALFGMAIEVFFEATTPLLHVLGCMKLAQLSHTWLYKALGLVFVSQFFALRMVVSNAYMVQLVRIVLALAERPWWAWTGVVVYGLLNCLNAFWFIKLLRMAVGSKKGSSSAAGSAQGTAAGDVRRGAGQQRVGEAEEAEGRLCAAATNPGAPLSATGGSKGRKKIIQIQAFVPEAVKQD